jgi:hypothetical protein
MSCNEFTAPNSATAELDMTTAQNPDSRNLICFR